MALVCSRRASKESSEFEEEWLRVLICCFLREILPRSFSYDFLADFFKERVFFSNSILRSSSDEEESFATGASEDELSVMVRLTGWIGGSLTYLTA